MREGFAQVLTRRVVVYGWLIVICLAFASPSLAIEKRQKEAPAKKPDTTAVAKPQAEPESLRQTRKPGDTVKTAQRRQVLPVFNDFIDVNMNGIDDRLEQGGYFIPPKQKPKAPTAKKADRADSTKAAATKSTAEKKQKSGK